MKKTKWTTYCIMMIFLSATMAFGFFDHCAAIGQIKNQTHYLLYPFGGVLFVTSFTTGLVLTTKKVFTDV